jgi:hypothetical protein
MKIFKYFKHLYLGTVYLGIIQYFFVLRISLKVSVQICQDCCIVLILTPPLNNQLIYRVKYL